MFAIAITDHLEGPADRASAEVYQEVAELVRLGDELGVQYALFAEHHAHAHFGHCPTPLLFALHLAGQTRRIQLGTAIVCANLHDPLDFAEQVAVADVLSGGRIAPGFGSGSTPEEVTMFGLPQLDESGRHARFERSLETILGAWAAGRVGGSTGGDMPFLPMPASSLASRSFSAVNSVGAARVAGRFNLNVLFSHLRTPAQYNEYRAAYRAAGGRGLIAANRPVYVAKDDATAWAQAEPALRTLWRRFRHEGKIAADIDEPVELAPLCDHPINFIVGGPESVARQLGDLHRQSPFDIANLEFRWASLPHEQVLQSLRLLMTRAVPHLGKS